MIQVMKQLRKDRARRKLQQVPKRLFSVISLKPNSSRVINVASSVVERLISEYAPSSRMPKSLSFDLKSKRIARLSSLAIRIRLKW